MYRRHPFVGKTRLITAIVAASLTGSAWADSGDTEARIAELQKQMEAMSQELAAMQQQLANAKDDKIKEKGKSEGSPVYAAFKDGLTFEDGSGNWKLQINGRVQADYRFDGNDEWSATSSQATTSPFAVSKGSWDSFSIRRARLGATFTFLKDFSARVEGEYSNEAIGNKANTALTYGYLDFARWKGAKIRVGQFKPFFGLERAESTNFTDFAELSLATANGPIFTSTYDRGIMVFGDPLPWLNYNVMLTNGSAQNNDDINTRKDIGGRVNANFAQLAEIKNAVIHVGASASDGNIGYTNQASTKGTLKAYTEGAGSSNYGKEFFSVAGLSTVDNGPDRTRWGLETALAYGPVKFQAEYINANFQGKYKPGTTILSYDNDIKAWYADLSWLVTGESWSDSYKSGVFGRIKPKSNFNDKDGWGALELDLRYSKFDATDFAGMLANTATKGTVGCTPTKISAAGTLSCYASEANAWTFGVKWILNPNARIVLNYTRTDFDNPIKINGKIDDKEDAGILRAQFDF